MTIYAKAPVTDTTSYIAGGQFEPSQIWTEYNTPDTKPILDDYLRRSPQRLRGDHELAPMDPIRHGAAQELHSRRSQPVVRRTYAALPS